MAGAFSLTAALSLQLSMQSIRNIRSQLEKSLSGFELKIQGLRTLGATAQTVAEVRKEINSLSTSLGVNARELASASQQFKQLGLSAREMGTALRAVSQASLLPGFGSVAQTASASANALRAFKMSADQLRPSLDAIHSMSERFGTSAERLLESVSHLGSGFAKKGGSLRELTAILATARNETGLSEQELNGALHHMFGRLSRPNVVKNLSDLGIPLRNEKNLYVGHFEALQRISAGVSGLSPLDSRYQAVASQLGGVRQYGRLVGFLTSAKQAREALTVAELSAFDVETKSSIMLDTWGGRMAKLEERFSSVQRSLMGSPWLKTFADWSLTAADAVWKFANSLETLIPVAATLGGMALLRGGIGAIGSRMTVGRAFAGLGIANAVIASNLPRWVSDPQKVARGSPAERSDYVRANGLAGGYSGAALGLVAGSYFGPIGMAVGGVAGAIVGYTRSIKNAKQELEAIRFSQIESEISSRIKDLASGGVALTQARLIQASADLKTLETTSQEKALSFAKEKGTDYFSALQATRKETISPLSSDYIVAATRQIEQAARVRGATGEGVYQQFRGSEFGTVLTQNLVNMGKAATDVEESFRKLADSAVKSAAVERGQRNLRVSEAQTSYSLSLLAKGLQSAALSLSDLEGRSKLLSEAFAGQSGMISRPNFSHALGLPGTPAFGPAVRQITPLMGNFGPEISKQAKSIDELKRILPSILETATRSGSALEGRSFSDKVISALSENKNLLPEHVNAIESHLAVLAQSPAGEGKLIEKLSGGIDHFAAELSDPVANPVLNSLRQFGEALEKRANATIQAAHDYQSGLRQIISRQAELSSLQLNQKIFLSRIQAENAGRPSDYLSLVSIREMQQPFRQNQETLTGLAGESALDPTTISQRLRRSLQQAESIRSQRDKAAPGSQESVKLATEFAHAQSATIQLRQALVNLTDVTRQTVGIQERLNKIEEDRTSRHNYGERFLSSDLRGRIEMLRGQALVRIAAGQGHIGNFSTENQARVLSSLSSMGNARLTALGGISAADLKRRLVENTLPGVKLDAGTEHERQDLLGEMAKAHERAIAAQAKLMEFEKDTNAQLRKLQGDYFKSAENMNARFLNELKAVFLQQQNLAQNAKISSLQGNLSELRSPGYNLLRRLNITQPELELLQADKNKSAMTDFAKFNEQLKAVRATNLKMPVNRIDMEMESEFVAAGPRGPETRKVFSDSAKNQKTISDVLSNSGVHDIDFQREVYNEFKKLFTKQPGANTSNLLQQAFGNVKQQFVGQNLFGMEKARGQLQARTGIAPEKMEAVLKEVVSNTKQMSEALANVHNIADLTKKIDELVSQLRAAKSTSIRDRIFNTGKRLLGLADGGHIHGTYDFRAKGTDTVPAMLTPGEYVIRASAARKHRHLLDKINHDEVPYYADGGEVILKKKHGRNPFSKYRIDPNEKRLSPLGLYYQQLHLQQHYALRLMEQQRRAAMGLNLRRNVRRGPARPVGDAVSLDEIRAEQERYPNLDDMLNRAARKQAIALHEQQRKALVRAGVAHRRYWGVRVGDATPLNEIRNRRAGPIGQMAKPDFTRISPNAPPIRHFADGGPVGRSNLDALNRRDVSPSMPDGFSESLTGFAQSMSGFSHLMNGFSGSANILSKAMEAMPRMVNMQGTHNHTHTHFGLDGLGELKDAIEQSHEERATQVVYKLLKQIFPHAGIV